MPKNICICNRRFPAIFIIISILYCSCFAPSINSFTVSPLTITAQDTVRVNWDVKGNPTLLVHEKAAQDSGIKYLEMTLVVDKGSKEINRPVQVTVIPANTTTQIIFRTALNGDTLVASDDKNSDKWGNRFEIFSVASASARPLMVWHANKTALLDKEGTPLDVFEGTPVEGKWVFKSLMTAEEKNDPTKRPETLQINATIKYKRR